jgi:alkylation response protein AidB-like acyl-CoA dehydrogenase
VDFSLTEEQMLLRDLIERFASDRYELADRARCRAEPAGYAADNWAALAELGLLGLPFSAADGGLDGGAVEIITLMEGIGRGLVVEPVLEEVILAAGLLAEAGDERQRAAWMEPVIAGEKHLGLAHFEPAARFDLASVATVARRAGDSWRLDGEKHLVLAAGNADAFIVTARESGDAGDFGLYLVDRDAPGVGKREFRLADGSMAAALKFDGAPAGERLAGGGDAFARVVDRTRIAACAEMLGIMSRLFDATLEYVRNRKQFGAPLGSFQVIQHRLADLYVGVEQSRSQLLRAALAAEASPDFARAVAGMKSYIASAAVQVGEECIHLHGAMGTTDELAIGHGHKRILVLATLFGDTDFELERFIRLAA